VTKLKSRPTGKIQRSKSNIHSWVVSTPRFRINNFF